MNVIMRYIKSKLILVSLLLVLVGCTGSNNKRLPKTGQFYDPQEKETGEVFVCTGKRSHAYHSNKECFGLSSCSGDIVVLTMEEAIEEGRTPCHFCHKKKN